MTAVALKGLAAIPLGEIKPSPRNVRSRLNDIDDLAVSIRENGLIQPIVVQQIPGTDGYQILAGHRRFAAVRKLKWTNVPCIIRRDMLPDEELVTMLVENGQRSNLDPIEEARALNRLRMAGESPADIGRRIGRPASYVDGRLMLLKLSQEEQDRVRAGHYTIGHAQSLVRAERQNERLRKNPIVRPIGRPKGSTTKPYFGDTHPLAQTARAICGHRGAPKVSGGVACGSCWETAIRADAQGGTTHG